MTYGQPRQGTDRGPQSLRAAGLVSRISALHYEVLDTGDVPMHVPRADDPPSKVGGKHAYAVGISNQKIAQKVQAEAAAGRFVLTLGGDHSIAMGTVAGMLQHYHKLGQRGPGIVWVDAHADINDPSTSPSGNIHGMPLSFLMKLFETSAVPGCEWLSDIPRLARDQIVYVGLREVDAGEKAAIKNLGLKAYTMKEVDALGIGNVMREALQHLNTAGYQNLHLSYDIDGVDPVLAPATGTRVPGGLSYREAHYIAEACADSGKLRSMDMVEINPDLANEHGRNATVDLGIELVLSALGKSILD